MRFATIEAFAVTGREARTTNAQEMSGQGVISRMWGECVRGSEPIIAVYSEYESDKNVPYNFLLGAKAEDGVGERQVESGVYIVFQGEGDNAAEMVSRMWQHVWHLEQAGAMRRAYKTDFELYSGKQVELYAGLKAF